MGKYEYVKIGLPPEILRFYEEEAKRRSYTTVEYLREILRTIYNRGKYDLEEDKPKIVKEVQ